MTRWKLPRLRFSLRTFLVLICIIGALLGLAAHRIETGKQRWAKIAELQRLGVHVGFGDELREGRASSIEPMNWWTAWRDADQALELNLVSIGPKVSKSQAFELMQDFPNIQSISLAGVGADDSIAGEVARHRNVDYLALLSTQITDAGLEQLAGMPQLRFLVLPPQTSDAGLVHVAKLPNLKELILAHAAITDDGLKHLADGPGLFYLNLMDTDVTDEGVRNITGIKSLLHLVLSRTRITGDCGARLSQMKDLQRIQLDGTEFDDAGLASIKSLPLEYLNLAGTKITDEGLKYLRGTDIAELDLSNTDVSGEGLRFLIDCHELESITLNGTRIGDQDIPLLLQFPDHVYIQLAHEQLTEEGLELLSDKEINIFP